MSPGRRPRAWSHTVLATPPETARERHRRCCLGSPWAWAAPRGAALAGPCPMFFLYSSSSASQPAWWGLPRLPSSAEALKRWGHWWVAGGSRVSLRHVTASQTYRKPVAAALVVARESGPDAENRLHCQGLLGIGSL